MTGVEERGIKEDQIKRKIHYDLISKQGPLVNYYNEINVLVD